ncbi:SART-1 protein [Sporodiniella umbellata]|nr:SART-1 protein [Sporodiniella umbellata]
MADSLSIEETNALREKLGLPPLATQDSDEEETVDPQQEAFENYQKLLADRKKVEKEKQIKENLEKSQNRKRNLAKLQGKGLGESSDEEESPLNWVKKSRTREQDLASRRAQTFEEMDESFQEYGAAQLSGMKVAHALNEFEEGGETILTIKDRGILEEEEEEDELTNVNLEDKERLEKNLDNKKKKPGYNPYDEDPFDGQQKSILPQYEEDEGHEGFVIGQAGTVTAAQTKAIPERPNEHTLSYEKMQEIKDYYTQEEMNTQFKKPKSKKKKKSSTRRKKTEEEDEIPAPATVTRIQRSHDPDANFVDDDDLQEALSRARRVANKQKTKAFKKMTPEEIARQIKEAEDVGHQVKMETEEEGGLVLSETSEFVSALGTNMPRFVEPTIKKEIKVEMPAPESSVKMEEVKDEDEPMPDIKEEWVEEVMVEEVKEEEPIIEEPLVSGGLAATLSLLNQKGMIAKPTHEQIRRDKIAADQIRWQNDQRKKEHRRAQEEQKEKERRRDHGRGREFGRDQMREMERERERNREYEDSIRMKEFEASMQNYKPEVNLEYTDNKGRVLKQGEAFRFMSHQFHGKTSGKTKTEKRMRKIEEERRLNMMSSTDTPLNLAGALLERQQRTGSAHVVLSVGNRGVVPNTINDDKKKAVKKKNKTQ